MKIKDAIFCIILYLDKNFCSKLLRLVSTFIMGSIPGQVIPKTQKMVLDISLFNTQHYKVRIKDKVEQSKERSSALPYTSV